MCRHVLAWPFLPSKLPLRVWGSVIIIIIIIINDNVYGAVLMTMVNARVHLMNAD